MEPLLDIRDVSKKYCRNLRRSLGYALSDALRGFWGITPPSFRLRNDEFWAIREVTLQLRKGDLLGIAGRNGSGKTTLLRLLSGIIPPDQGEIRVFGRMGTLLTIGVGFHPHMSVKDNIFLEGVHLGMTTSEIKGKLDFIREFSGIGEFFDAPVAALSSGMYVRLGFSVALSVQPQVLLVDEILSVADEQFREKCVKEIQKTGERGGAILVSHNLDLIRSTCNRLVVLEKGRVSWSGNDVDAGLKRFHSLSE